MRRVVEVFDVAHVLAKAIFRRDRREEGVEEEEALQGQNASSTQGSKATHECKIVDMVVDSVRLDNKDSSIHS
jgi:phage terminase small subunit